MTINITSEGQSLIAWGTVLFALGLVQGLAIPFFRNPRMALSAHLTAVQCGMALMVFGIAWTFFNLSGVWSIVAHGAMTSGFWLIWLGISLAAVTGASKALPLAGEGHTGKPLAEHLVIGIEAVGVVLSLLGAGIVVAGLSGFG